MRRAAGAATAAERRQPIATRATALFGLILAELCHCCLFLVENVEECVAVWWIPQLPSSALARRTTADTTWRPPASFVAPPSLPLPEHAALVRALQPRRRPARRAESAPRRWALAS